MTKGEARKIFKSWQEYMEIADKLRKLFSSIPESFLPYPKEILEEAINMVAREYFDAGDKKMVNTIETTLAGFLWIHKGDGEAIDGMYRDLELMLRHPDLKKIKIKKLIERKEFWLKDRENASIYIKSDE